MREALRELSGGRSEKEGRFLDSRSKRVVRLCFGGGIAVRKEETNGLLLGRAFC